MQKTRKKRAALIGLGMTTLNYSGITEAPYFDLVCVSDNDESAIGRLQYDKLPYYKDFQEMLKHEQIDFAIVSLSPSNRYKTAKYLLEHNVGVLVQKPAALSMNEVEILVSIAKRNNLFFDVIFDWQYKPEICFLKQKIELLGEPKKAYVTLFSPQGYKESGVKPRGTWFEGGLNALSVLSLFFNADNLEIVAKTEYIDRQKNIPTCTDVLYNANGKQVTVLVDHTSKNDFNRTTIILDTGVLDICHNRQIVRFNGEEIFCAQKTQEKNADYFNFFQDFCATDKTRNILDVHWLYFLTEQTNIVIE